MIEVFYHILAVLVTAFALVRGFRQGLTRQTDAVLGFAFGSVCAHVFGPKLQDTLMDMFHPEADDVMGPFICDTWAVSLIYVIVFIIVITVTKPVVKIVRIVGGGLLDSLLGSIFSLLKYILFLSILYNLSLCINPGSKLLRHAVASDGNIVAAVMSVAPAMLGSCDLDSLWHLIQLKEARKISRNIPAGADVNNHETALKAAEYNICMQC